MTRGVIFDLDGVLVTTDELHYRAWKELAEAEGIDFDRKANERLRGVSRMQSLKIILERAARAYSDEEKQKLADFKNERYRELLRQLTPDALLPGAVETLTGLRDRGVAVALASSSRNAPLILEKLDLARHFDAVVDGNDIMKTKPDPEIFLLAAERLGLQPSECLVVEDAAAGVEAARRAGMAVLGIGVEGADASAPSLANISIDALLSL